MKFGAHVSIMKSIAEAPRRAHEIGCECFQIFSRSPRGGRAMPLTKKLVEDFKKECKKYKFTEVYIHTPYFINLGSTNNRVYYGSISAIGEDLERASKLGAKYAMTHLGSAKEVGIKKSLKMAAEGIRKVLDGYKGKTKLLIEISAGAGQIIGDTFEEIAVIIKLLPKNLQSKVGICFDTAHAFESGYDLRTKEAVKETLDKFDKILGLNKLKLIHANDSKTDLGSHVDRHEHIGEGKIGLEGFRAIVKEPRLKDINMIIETPWEGAKKDVENLKKLKRLRR